eukprot:1178804-Prorocentrum_minimum.AAC.3
MVYDTILRYDGQPQNNPRFRVYWGWNAGLLGPRWRAGSARRGGGAHEEEGLEGQDGDRGGHHHLEHPVEADLLAEGQEVRQEDGADGAPAHLPKRGRAFACQEDGADGRPAQFI